MRIYNFPDYFAKETLRRLGPSSTVDVYSNVDPTREWTGRETLEFAEDEPETNGFISSRRAKTHKLVAYSRSATERAALAIVDRLRPLVLNDALLDLRESGAIYAFSIDDVGTTADIRGYAVGETFYGYLNFTVTVKERGFF